MKNKNKQTKFPVARIKKIMQKDEEVGKVAQATPIVISKALELFLRMIVDEAAKVTTERNSKRVEAYHLKHAIERTDMLDFLKEIVAGVPDPSAGGTIDVEAEKADGKKKKSGAPRKRKRKDTAASATAPSTTGGARRRGAGRAGDDGGMDEMDEGGGNWAGNDLGATGAGSSGAGASASAGGTDGEDENGIESDWE